MTTYIFDDSDIFFGCLPTQGKVWARGVNFGNGTTIVATENNQFSVWLVRQP